MWHIHIKLTKFLIKILEWYCGNNFSVVSDRKDKLSPWEDKKVASDETLVSLDVSALLTSTPIPVALENHE